MKRVDGKNAGSGDFSRQNTGSGDFSRQNIGSGDFSRQNTGSGDFSRRKNNKSGYALLFILMMAAALAIMLYMQLPRVAFEAQRDREQLLIDRGEQYKRAIQLYVRKFNRFPADMQALENTQNIRFLRKQYIDPMTGKSEWRLIHVGPNGALTDSKVSGTNQQQNPASAPQTLVADLSMTLGGTNQTQGINQAARRRPSDDPGNAGGDPNNPGAATGPVMVLPDGRIVPATSTGVPANTASNPTGGPLPGPSGNPAQFPSLPGQPVQPGQTLAGGFQNTPNTPSPGAANLINQILTTPRPGGFNGLGNGAPTDPGTAVSTLSGGPANNTGTPLGQTLGGSTVGGGIAGVASKREQGGIKVYNNQTSYEKWEFVYDMSKDKTRTGGAGVPQQAPQPQGNPATPAPIPPPASGNPGTSGTGN